MTQKIALITGANKSIGFETARQLGKLGYKIWLGSRDRTRGEAAVATLQGEGVDVEFLELDVTNQASVAAAAAHVSEASGHLDVLINNAGIVGASADGGAPPPPSLQDLDEIRGVYETNVFGAIRVTQAFLPHLKAAPSANIVMVSSGLGSLTWLSDRENEFHGINILGYNTSKSALNAVTLAFSKELAPLNIKVNAADPGYTATDLNGYSGYRSVEQAAAGIVWLATLDVSGPTGGYYFEQTPVPW